MTDLTVRQKRVFRAIERYFKKHLRAPTYLELANKLDFGSPNGAYEACLAIEKKGFIEITKGVARGIRIV